MKIKLRNYIHNHDIVRHWGWYWLKTPNHFKPFKARAYWLTWRRIQGQNKWWASLGKQETWAEHWNRWH